jgi:hypothetical protein
MLKIFQKVYTNNIKFHMMMRRKMFQNQFMLETNVYTNILVIKKINYSFVLSDHKMFC